MSSPVKKGGSLDKWIVRKHGKIKKVIPLSSKILNNTEHHVTKKQLDQRIKLRRQQQQRTQQLTLHGTIIIHDDLKEYGHPYSLSMAKNPKETISIHSHNVDNLPLYASNVTNQLIYDEFKKQEADIYLWQETGICWPKVEKYDSWQQKPKVSDFIQI